MNQITVIVPCYNEAERLDLHRFSRFLRESPGVRLLMVNDGSKDDTLNILGQLQKEYPESISLLNLTHNGGKAEAIRLGFLAIADRSEFVGYWDADLATPLEAIPQFANVLKRFPKLDLIMGSRVQLLGRNIQRRWRRHLLGRCFATCASRVLRLPVYDTQCGAKLFRATPLIRSLFTQPFCSRWIFDVELLARLIRTRNQLGLSPACEVVYELPLDDWQEVAGSKLRPRDFFKAITELFSVWRRYRPGLSHSSPETTDDISLADTVDGKLAPSDDGRSARAA